MSTRQWLCLAVRLGNWRQSPLLTTKCQKISKSLQLWMRCIFFIQQLCLSSQRLHHRALSVTAYDKFLNLSDGMLFSTQQIITSNLKLYHILIWKTLPSMSQLIHKCRKNHAINSSRHLFPAALLVKRCTLLTSSSTKPRGVSPLWFYHKLRFIYSMNKLPRSWLLLLQQLNIKLSVVKCRPLRNHPRGIKKKKKKPRTLKRTPLGSFFFKRPTCSSRNMSNCTHKVDA